MPTITLPHLRPLLPVLLLALCLPIPASAATPGAWPSAEESDPRALGFMQGFPPPPSRQIGQPDSNFFSFPKMRWSVCHMEELLPTERVSRGLGAPRDLPRYPLEKGIDALAFTPLGSDQPMTWLRTFLTCPR